MALLVAKRGGVLALEALVQRTTILIEGTRTQPAPVVARFLLLVARIVRVGRAGVRSGVDPVVALL